MEYENDKIRLRIEQDETGENSRNWDNLGIMVCLHKRYNLGDKHEIKSEDFNGWDEIRDYLIKECGAVAILPLRMYDHSGISLSTTADYPYNDRWDSGQVGFIYTTKERIKAMYGKKPSKAQLEEILREEVKTYDQDLNGEVYGYILEKKDKCDKCGNMGYETLDSCWGFYGLDIKENGMLDHIAVEYHKEILEMIKKGN